MICILFDIFIDQSVCFFLLYKVPKLEVSSTILQADRNLLSGRRCIRFFRFVDNLSRAWDSFCDEKRVDMLVGVGKSGFMGAYLGREFHFFLLSPALFLHFNTYGNHLSIG